MAPLQPLLLSAFTLVVGVLLIVLGSTVVNGHNGWPLLSLTFYVFTPVPFFLCGGGHRGDYQHRLSLFRMLGLFVGGVCATAGPALAVMLYRIGSLSLSALWLTLASGVCFFVSFYFLRRTGDGESDDDVEEDDLFG